MSREEMLLLHASNDLLEFVNVEPYITSQITRLNATNICIPITLLIRG